SCSMFEFRLPSLGADMDAGTLVAWHVKPGDAVKRGQVVADVETDKGIVEIEIWQEGTLADVLLFGGLLVWAVADFVSVRRRDRAATLVTPKGAIGRDAVTVGVGLITWFVVARYLHGWLFGVAPLA
ncbi:MAG TPA: NnrU family protein, partial [Thauera sp.]|nr:NnrU family protein [Thauera sp.]